MTTEVATRTIIRHLDLPLVDQREVEGALGFAKLVGLVASLPLTILGVTVVATGLVFQWPMLSMVAATVTLAILVALHEDTRLPKALDMLARGDVERAERALEQVAVSGRRSSEQRQSARAHLASIAWKRGEVAGALRWTRERIRAHDGSGRARLEDRYLSDATEVQLLALCGERDAAREALARLGPTPDGDFARLTGCTTELMVSFCAHEPEGVRADLEALEALATRTDGVGTSLLLVAWVRHERGEAGRAQELVELAREQGDVEYVRAHYPALWKWADAYAERLHYSRG